MSLFDRILRRFIARPPLREAVEDAFARDDGQALVDALRGRQHEGKQLIRELEQEIATTPEKATRDALVRCITALVAVYAKAFDDLEPMEWFRRHGDAPELQLATQRLEEAKRLVADGDYAAATDRAESGLRIVNESPAPNDPDALSLRSALLGVAGGAALRSGDSDGVQARFEEALEKARASGKPPYVAAALFNLVDLHTRRGTFAQADALFEEAESAVAATNDATPSPAYEDVLAKLSIERGVALIQAGDLERAVPTLDLAVRVRGDWPFPLYQRAWARFLGGDSGGAADDYRDCAKRKRVFFTVQREIRCLEDVGAGALPLDIYRSFCAIRDNVRTNPSAVDEAMERMIDRVPAFAPAHALQAEARLARGDTLGARTAAEEALSHDPDEDTAAASLFVQWLIARSDGDREAASISAQRLETAYPEQPAAMLVKTTRESPDRDHAFRWTWAFDGTLRFDEVDPASPPPDRSDPPPGSHG